MNHTTQPHPQPSALRTPIPLVQVFDAVSSAVAISNALLREAYALHASDIHLDPGAGSLIARMRVHGTLRDTHQIPHHLHTEILARLKILAGLRTDEHITPQDGRFRFEISSTETIDIRVSIAPTYYGENAVLRLLTSRDTLSTLSSLGCGRAHQHILTQAIAKPYGMVLVTGPTGSGKTSTLYALLRMLNTRDVSIVTIEDPIEYAIDGINQIPADTTGGLSFASGLRSMLRQDPNIIGIGEIRDTETAALATNAALTGHLVLSTLHTTDAPTAIPRLIDMHVEPYLVASTITAVVNQRLVRKLCPACKTKAPLRKEQRAILATLPHLSISITDSYESKGCAACNGTGAVGRMGLFEIMTIDSSIRESIVRKAASKELSARAVSEGMIPLIYDGLRKAAEGTVSLDEVLLLISE